MVVVQGWLVLLLEAWVGGGGRGWLVNGGRRHRRMGRRGAPALRRRLGYRRRGTTPVRGRRCLRQVYRFNGGRGGSSPAAESSRRHAPADCGHVDAAVGGGGGRPLVDDGSRRSRRWREAVCERCLVVLDRFCCGPRFRSLNLDLLILLKSANIELMRSQICKTSHFQAHNNLYKLDGLSVRMHLSDMLIGPQGCTFLRGWGAKIISSLSKKKGKKGKEKGKKGKGKEGKRKKRER